MRLPGLAIVRRPAFGQPAPAYAWHRLRRDTAGLAGLGIIAIFLFLSLGTWTGLLGGDWSLATGSQWEPASAQHWFGTNRLGQDVYERAVRSTGTAFQIGLLVAVSSTMLGAALGGLAGWRAHGIPDQVILWVMGVMDSIPFYLFAAALAFALSGFAWAMHIAMVVTFWTTTGRLVRGEVLHLRELDFVASARTIGVPDLTILFRHVLPNTTHILLVQASLTFVAAIKTEVILSFLGLGVQDGVSWGLMLAESTQDVLAGHFGNFVAASSFLFLLLMGFNMLADAIQDAVDVRETIA